MLGQSFAPLGNDPTQQKPGGPSGNQGAQQAIQVLNTRLPRVVGAGAPAPQALLQGAGSAGLPSPQGVNPIVQAILQAVLGHFAPQQQSAPSAMGGMVPGGMPGGMPGGGMPAPSGPLPKLPTPALHYQPLPGGTAGPNTNTYKDDMMESFKSPTNDGGAYGTSYNY